jgi:hypothetical protein
MGKQSDDQPVDRREISVRTYLVALTDPNSLIDQNEILALETACERASDPIDKLKALSKLERARVVDFWKLERAFVRDARQWAEREGVEADAFRALGVPDAILSEAGLTTRSRSQARRSSAGEASETRSVRTHTIQQQVIKLSDPFSLSDVASLVGGSPMTVRKAVDELVQTGCVRRLGPDPRHTGRGRAPILYEVVEAIAHPAA